MPNNDLVKKLQIKSGYRSVILNPPEGYLQLLAELPADVQLLTKIESPLDFAQLFVKTSLEVETQIPTILKALKKDGLFWVCYPKGGSKIKSELNRDILWREMEKFGLAGVSLISIDNTWSAMRFRPADKVGH